MNHGQILNFLHRLGFTCDIWYVSEGNDPCVLDVRRPIPFSAWDIKNGGMSFFVERLSTQRAISHFSFYAMPLSPQIVCSQGAFVFFEYRNRGIGTALNEFRIWLAKTIGFKTIMCTVNTNNDAQLKILHKNKWLGVSAHNGVDIFIKNLE